MSSSPTRVVVAGGGFGGVYAALQLAHDDPGSAPVDVLLVSERNHFTFTPLLHDVLGGSLGAQHVAAAYRVLARRRGLRFLQARVVGVDAEGGRIETTAGSVDFDYLILALGAAPITPDGDGYAGADADAGGPGEGLLVTPFHRIPHAVSLHDRVLRLAERASREGRVERRRELLTFVVAGGGPAGVEAAGELIHLMRDVLPRFYDGMEAARVVLVHPGERLLSGWDEALVRRGQETLRERGVDLRLETRVEGHADGEVRVGGGADAGSVSASTLIWAVGTRPSSAVLEGSGLPLGDDGRVRVDEHLRVRGHERIYAVGDLNDLHHPHTGEPYPDVAPIALSQGIRAAGNVLADRGGWPLEAYRGDHAGKIVTLGGRAALVDVLGLTLHGRPAWLVNRGAYLLKLVGARNKAQAAATLLLNRLFSRNLLAGATAFEHDGWRTGEEEGGRVEAATSRNEA